MMAVAQMAQMMQAQQAAMTEAVLAVGKPRAARVKLSDGRVITMEQQ
jgi:hypothetical protein